MEHLPDGVEHPDADAVVELVTAAGLFLDPWQEYVLRRSLLRRGRKWAAFEVGVCCPRQNGKNGIIEARELGGLFVLGEKLIVHSAHLADTSKEAFRRLEGLIDANDWLSSEVKHVWRTNGHEAIELQSGQRIRFRTRTKGGGRGFSGSPVIFDEAMYLPETSVGAMMPVVSAQPDPQLWYTGSAVDQTVHEHGMAFSRLRHRALDGGDPSLAYFEWSAEGEDPEDVDGAAEPDVWAVANPAFGIRIMRDHIANEYRSMMGGRTFAVERLGVGDWPNPDAAAAQVIPRELWDVLADPDSAAAGEVCFAFDVSPDRAWTTVSVAGTRPDGHAHVEIVERRRGTGWLVEYITGITGRHETVEIGVVCDGAGPAGSLLPELELAGVVVTPVTVQEHGRACGMLYDAVAQANVRHRGDQVLTAAVRGAAVRPLGDAWAWSRKNSQIDITPLVSCTLAYWGAMTAVQGGVIYA